MFDDSFPDDVPGDRHRVIRELRHRIGTVDTAGRKQGGSPAVHSPAPTPVSTAVVGSAAVNPTEFSDVGIEPIEGTGSVLPVTAPLAAVLPRGGLARGSVVSVLGQGATSLLFTLLSGPRGPWSALVGMPGIGLLAAAEFGIDLDRVAVIPEPGPDVLQVLSILMDGVDMIAVALPERARPTPSRQRVLTGRLRQRGAVLLVMGPWPGADLVLTARLVGWAGLGRGHGRLRDRELVVDIGGRGSAAGRGGRAALLLRAGRGSVEIGQGRIGAGEIGAPSVVPVAGVPTLVVPAAAVGGATVRRPAVPGTFEPVAEVG